MDLSNKGTSNELNAHGQSLRLCLRAADSLDGARSTVAAPPIALDNLNLRCIFGFPFSPLPERCPMPPVLSPRPRPSLQPTTYNPLVANNIRVCPECAGEIVRNSGCMHCRQCGWGKCG